MKKGSHIVCLSLFHLVFLALTSHASRIEGQKEEDRIETLPGQPGKVNFEQYSGFVTINETAGRALFYYFVEADGAKDEMPLVLWLNGGPGCSSVAGGAFQELGPFRVASDGKTLFRNEFAWNKVANVLFLEAPIAVGYSYTNKSSDVENLGDQQTASDNYDFLVKWFERFPEYKNKTFYIAGESYAGHYVPQLAQIIMQNNKLGKSHINLKGIALGNPLIEKAFDELASYEYLYEHSIVSKEDFAAVQDNCNFSLPNPMEGLCFHYTMIASFGLTYYDKYNIYKEVCNFTGLTGIPKDTSVLNVDPCTKHYTEAYLGRKDVQLAFHVTNFNRTYSMCTDIDWKEEAPTVLPILKALLNDGIPIWVYGGDLDSQVSVKGTLTLLKRLNLAVDQRWRTWYIDNAHETVLGGYTVVFEGGLTYATVKGSGHLVPLDTPEAALLLFNSFIKQTPLPE